MRKDKLYYNNHNGLAFKFKKMLLTFSLALTAAIIITVPTYIAATSNSTTIQENVAAENNENLEEEIQIDSYIVEE